MIYPKNKTKFTAAAGLIAALLIILGNAPFVSTKATAFSPPPQTPEQAAVQFYKWYIGELNRDRDPRTQQRRKLTGFLSRRFAGAVYSIPDDRYDADVFIDAQDWDKDWVRAVSTTRAAVRGNSATLKVILGVDQRGRLIKSKWKHELNLRMVKEGGAWKIDRINDY